MRWQVLALVSFALFLVVSGPASAQDPEPRLLEKAMANPTATGLLVTRVFEGSQAEDAGMAPGDIIVAYGETETPDIPAMNHAKVLAEREVSVMVRVVRDGWERAFEIWPGPIGVQLMPVVKGARRAPLPLATVTDLDLSSLADGDRDDWFYLVRDGQRCGLARINCRLVGPGLYVLSEEIIDTETELLDHEVTSVADLTARMQPLVTVFRDRMNDRVLTGFKGSVESGCPTWNSVAHGEGSESERASRELPPRAIPVYTIETLAVFMPRKPGACFRFLPLNEGSGEVMIEGALVSIGEETVEIEGKEKKGFRVDWLQLDGSTAATFWVGEDGRMLLMEYGVIRAVRCSHAAALEDQPEGVTARINR